MKYLIIHCVASCFKLYDPYPLFIISYYQIEQSTGASSGLQSIYALFGGTGNSQEIVVCLQTAHINALRLAIGGWTTFGNVVFAIYFRFVDLFLIE